LLPRAVLLSTTNHEKERHIGRVAVTESVTLDGFFEDPGGAEDFAHGG
jgi:hypothetical protein